MLNKEDFTALEKSINNGICNEKILSSLLFLKMNASVPFEEIHALLEKKITETETYLNGMKPWSYLVEEKNLRAYRGLHRSLFGPVEDMPLLINDPDASFIAKYRLKNGR